MNFFLYFDLHNHPLNYLLALQIYPGYKTVYLLQKYPIQIRSSVAPFKLLNQLITNTQNTTLTPDAIFYGRGLEIFNLCNFFFFFCGSLEVTRGLGYILCDVTRTLLVLFLFISSIQLFELINYFDHRKRERERERVRVGATDFIFRKEILSSRISMY